MCGSVQESAFARCCEWQGSLRGLRVLVVIIRGPKAAGGVPSGPIGSHSSLPHSPACALSVLLLLSMLAGHTMSSK